MPLYTVKAAHAHTGEDVELQIDARDKFAAERAAREQGYMVERVDFATLDYRRETPPSTESSAPLYIAVTLLFAFVLIGLFAWWTFG